jgi:membrane-associated phospholipid phosphatase
VYLFGVGFNVAMASFVINLLIGRKAVHMLVVLEGSCFLVCFLCFIVIPSPNTLTDNVPPTGSGASWWLYSTIIAPDAVNNANNMPSIHIVFLIAILLVSFSFIKKNVRTICMQSLSVVLFVTVSLSVLFVKQHFILDVIVAIILAIIFYIVFRFTKVFENNNLLFERMYLKMHLSNPKNVSR